jgi:predicted dinucleotide-binding enzyme
MRIAVLGTGNVGKTIGSRLVELGHEVTMGSRSADHEGANEWAASAGDNAGVGTFADAASWGEIVFNCTSGAHTLDALGLAGADNLNGKVIVDVANPLDFSEGFPPSLSVKDTDSLAEQVQRAYPDARVVKTLNTMNCGIMVDPSKLDGGDHVVFVSGNDDAAKADVTALLRDFGWTADQIIDLGDISTARGTEMFLPLWLRIMRSRGNADFNIAIVG